MQIIVKVKPKSKIEHLYLNSMSVLVFKTNKIPQNGEVNIHLIKTLAKTFNLSISLISIDPKTLIWSEKKVYLDIDPKKELEINNILMNLKLQEELF